MTLLALGILLVAAPVGAVDVVYFHLWKFRLFSRPQSRMEEVTHIARGIAVPAIFVFLLLGSPTGTFFFIVGALFLFDLLNSLIDTMIEPASRAPIGVPPNELALHFIGASLMAAAFAVFLIGGWADRSGPAAVVPWPPGTFPTWLPPLAWGGVAVSVALVAFEAALVTRYALARD